MSNFHIVSRVSNWQQHDEQKQQQCLQALQVSASRASARDLKKSAERFQPSDALLNAINIAIAARAPLLLTGEPGTGKTQVASYLERFFNIPLYSYQVHSNSQANELRYDFDAVAYLRDAYLAKQQAPEKNSSDNLQSEPHTDPRSNPRYLKPAALWQAYQTEGECVLLIDEIDKAPRDFPNDLLQELDQNHFAHPFHQNEKVENIGAPPITIITSNGERRLPDAFLRRCMVHHIELDNDLLKAIVTAWDSQFPELDEDSRELALQYFKKIRRIRRLSKAPGTAELLLWMSVLSAQNISKEDLENIELKDLPALECLLKDHNDYQYL